MFFFFAILTLTSVLPVLHSDAQDLVLVTPCGHNVTIPQGENATELLVNATFDNPQPLGASCSWVIPSPNSSASNQILLNVDELASLACGTNAFSLFEWDPRSSLNDHHRHPLTLYCFSTWPQDYQGVVSRPGFSILVSLNTTSALPEEFSVFFRLLTTSFADLCPETGRKVIDVPPGVFEQHENSLNLNHPSLVGRIPDYMTCRWEFRSRFGEAVVLRLKTYFGPNPPGPGVCPGNDTLLISDEENSDSTITIPYCKDPGVDYVYTGVTGKVFVTLQTDDTGGAYPDFYIYYWILDSCPTFSNLQSVLGQEEVIKGISNGVPMVGQNTSCYWVIESLSLSNSVVKLTRLQVDDQFQQNCDVSQDYLLINGKRNISLCSNSSNKGLFPIWSKSWRLEVTFHSQPTSSSRSFLLYYTGVRSGQCQGHPQFEWARDHVKNVALHPVQAEDTSEGSVCQWLFEAVTTGYVVQVELTRATSDTDPVGVEFNEDTCIYDSFSIYSGDTANDQTKINATCAKTPQRGSLIRYTSSSRNMLFVHHRDPHVPESGFVMEVRQIRDPATNGGSAPGNKMTLRGMQSVMLFFCFVLDFLGYV
ncbi:uncharacterized protein [Littorina saxatilis]|uniref:CUB domain-containing protein n=1 Tax=Littorina saxatilis TaxID=31220 RepID=A0AAN9BMF4_9CAEN